MSHPVEIYLFMLHLLRTKSTKITMSKTYILFSTLGNCINTLIRNIAYVSSRHLKLTTLLCASVGKHQFLFEINYNNDIYRACSQLWNTLDIVAI